MHFHVRPRQFLLYWTAGSLVLMMLVGWETSLRHQEEIGPHFHEQQHDAAESSSSATAAGGDANSLNGEVQQRVTSSPAGGRKRIPIAANAAGSSQSGEAATASVAAAGGGGGSSSPPGDVLATPQETTGATVQAAPDETSQTTAASSSSEATLPPATAVPAFTAPDGHLFTEFAVIHLDQGDIRIGLRRDAAPRTVANFVQLAKSGWYNKSCFYRYEKGFVLQGGGCAGNSAAETVPLEYKLPNIKYSVALARTSDPSSGSSEFFINLRDNSDGLGPKKKGGYAVFGHVVDGIPTIVELKKLPTIRPKKGGMTKFAKPQPHMRFIEIIGDAGDAAAVADGGGGADVEPSAANPSHQTHGPHGGGKKHHGKKGGAAKKGGNKKAGKKKKHAKEDDGDDAAADA